MKAKEYYDKYGSKIWASICENQPEIGKKLVMQLFSEMLKEAEDISEKRNVKSVAAWTSLFLEFNQRWNKICKMFEQDYHMTVLNKNGFIEYTTRDLPWVKEEIERRNKNGGR